MVETGTWLITFSLKMDINPFLPVAALGLLVCEYFHSHSLWLSH